jgi:hypothetical protein
LFLVEQNVVVSHEIRTKDNSIAVRG